MKKKKSLILYKNTFGLRVRCLDCNKLYNYDTLHLCAHGSDRQRYKQDIYILGETRSTQHETMDFNEALALAIKFKAAVKSGSTLPKNNLVLSQGMSIIEAGNLFLNYKHGIDVPLHMKENLSKQYLYSIQFYVGQFIEIMRTHGINVNIFPISELSEEHVGIWVADIRKRYSEGSWNGPLRIMRLWIDHLQKRHKIKMHNPFLDVKLVQFENNVTAITKSEFNAICNSVGKLNSIRQLKGKTNRQKNLYRPYLVDAFKLALYSGLRREEFLSLTFNDIYQIEDSNDYIIITDNLKVERMTGKKYKKKYVPVSDDLYKLLIDLEWEKYKGKDRFIIDSKRSGSVKTMMGNCTKAFSHYFEMCFPNSEPKKLNILRKTYLSYMGGELGEDVVKFSSHSGMKVLWNHYFDKNILARAKKVKIFG